MFCVTKWVWTSPLNISKFSSYQRLRRVTALVLHFINNVKEKLKNIELNRKAFVDSKFCFNAE